jgi:hypothetical protein
MPAFHIALSLVHIFAAGLLRRCEGDSVITDD